MQQTVIKVGNSLAVTVPRHFVKGRKLRPGQKVFVEADPELDLVQIRTRSRISSLTGEFKEWLDEVSKKYESAIKELAKK
ncbi:MAG: AbrB/MazE/SpoVT family DNA-binding domain-containing protein [Candidatus Blackburnbacteria bacterium]|nr:AbrB/MazE/SpoVT family DNA-binding domain-containing protein [Candidatus Blackburnbacteria bacterium]